MNIILRKQLESYISSDDKAPFIEWLESLKDPRTIQHNLHITNGINFTTNPVHVKMTLYLGGGEFHQFNTLFLLFFCSLERLASNHILK